MVVVMGVRSQEGEESIIAPVRDAEAFAFVTLGEGMRIEAIEFRKSFENELFDYIVTPDKHDDLEDAYDLGARALLAMPGMSVEEIVEALMFRELDEIV
ncbi:MAG: hypothetical protein C6H99_02115 [Epsilonproteobacteria bacterium]|nr:hypothetical protein [Campylobacterota bacterium]NPA63878.1 hypothetical protein [Campylobacterota bacterium]